MTGDRGTLRRPVRHPVAGLLLVTGLALLGTGCNDVTDQELYSLYCARCHAEDFTGRDELDHLGPGLDLTRSALIQDRQRGLIYRRIAWGWGAMPGYSAQLEQSDLDRLVTYVLTIPQEEP